MFKSLLTKYQIWRLQPGVIFSARLAEQIAWSHKNTSLLGPEQNLKQFSSGLHKRLREAKQGKIEGLYLNPVRGRGL